MEVGVSELTMMSSGGGRRFTGNRRRAHRPESSKWGHVERAEARIVICSYIE
jgi:hypothetical protein